MILLIDNYDSFTYNLVHLIGELEVNCIVKRNNMISVNEVLQLSPDAIVLSPGPCSPNEAGICLDLVQAAHDHNIPLLGVCLGHQSIGQAFGATIERCPEIMHGKTSSIYYQGNKSLFDNIPAPFVVTRYHSLHIKTDTIPDVLDVIASTANGIIMAIAHKHKPIYGVQFHPESIASEHGKQLIQNFFHLAGIKIPVQNSNDMYAV